MSIRPSSFRMADAAAPSTWIMGPPRELPSAVLRRHLFVSPFVIDPMQTLADTLGTSQILFGSDYPHGEGVPEPAHMESLFTPLGPEATANQLRLQIEQGVAMVITLGEKALDARVKIEEARAHRHTATELLEAVERALDEEDAAYQGELDEEDAAYRDAERDALDEQAHLDRDVTGERAWFNASFRIHPSGKISPLSNTDAQDDASDNDEA
jgi:hypothetical protein